MLAQSAVRLRGSAMPSRQHRRHRSRSANEADGSHVDGRLVDDIDPVQRVAEHKSGERGNTVRGIR
jgi:hypothetical protein